MRLLDVHSVTDDRLPVFREFHEDGPSSPPRYAILSHTWGKRQDNKEIVFDDIPSSETFAKFLDEATQLKQWQEVTSKKKAGFSKIINACQVAGGMGLNYIWIDSCCIDKSKSAELNESINSMYRWYKNSERCIVHLEDLESDGDLRQCRWFKRGWTLQELIAPSQKVTIYDRNWDFFGETSDTRFCESLSNITGVDMDCLQGVVELAALSTAHKMSWAAGRETSVPEDRAYSLMGLFDVNMPLIYGEGGTKAFRRLQEQIARVSSDLSIFAWDPCSEANTGLDAFASKPDEFAAYKDMVPSYQSQHFTGTNKGIEMRTILWQVICEDGTERLMLAIGKQKNGKLDVGIILRKLGHNMYMRRGNMHPFSEEQITSSTRMSTFYLISSHDSTGYDHVLSTSRNHAILVSPHDLGNFDAGTTVPQYAWDCEDRLFFNNRHWGGSDWRAIKLIYKEPAPMLDRRFVALFSLADEKPGCYLLRWRDQLAVMFDRRNQTETTRLEEFRFAVEGATDKIYMESAGIRLLLRLVPTTVDKQSGMQFRMEVQETPWGIPPSSVKPTNVTSLPPSSDLTGRNMTQNSGSGFLRVNFINGSGLGRGRHESMATDTVAPRGGYCGQIYGAMAGEVDRQSEATSDRPGLSEEGPGLALKQDFKSRLTSTDLWSAGPYREPSTRRMEPRFPSQWPSRWSSRWPSHWPRFCPSSFYPNETVFPSYVLKDAFSMTAQSRKRVFSQFQGTDEAVTESDSLVAYAALNGHSLQWDAKSIAHTQKSKT